MKNDYKVQMTRCQALHNKHNLFFYFRKIFVEKYFFPSNIYYKHEKQFVTIIMNFLFAGKETVQGTEIFPF